MASEGMPSNDHVIAEIQKWAKREGWNEGDVIDALLVIGLREVERVGSLPVACREEDRVGNLIRFPVAGGA